MFKHNPLSFHNRAMPSAKAAQAAGRQGKFWEMHDKLFENNKALDDASIKAYAKEIGLKIRTFEKDLADPALENEIKDMQSEGMKLGARGTPAFFVNGRFLSGAQPTANFVKLIDEELEKAEKLVATGVSRRKVYDRVVEHGKTSP